MDALLTRWLPNVDWTEIGYASLDTLNMLGGSLLFTVLLGLPLGVLLFLCGPRQLFEQKALYGLLSLLVNVLRSLPFLIPLIPLILSKREAKDRQSQSFPSKRALEKFKDSYSCNGSLEIFSDMGEMGQDHPNHRKVPPSGSAFFRVGANEKYLHSRCC